MFPTLLSIGPIHIPTLLVFTMLAWGIFSFLFWRQLRNQAISEEHTYQVMFYGTIAAIVGSRLGFVLFHWPLFEGNLFIRVFTPWIQPGFSFYGAFLAGGALMLAMSRQYGIPRSLFLDAFTIGFSSAFTWGALGSFLSGQVVGKPTTSPLGIGPSGSQVRMHPVSLYEMCAVFAILVLLSLVRKLRKRTLTRPGMYALWFFFLFSVSMFCLEFLKESPVYFSRLTVNQWVCIAIFAEATGALITWGGGLKLVRTYVPVLYKKISAWIGGVYAKLSKRTALGDSKTT